MVNVHLLVKLKMWMSARWTPGAATRTARTSRAASGAAAATASRYRRTVCNAEVSLHRSQGEPSEARPPHVRNKRSFNI